MPYRKRTKTLQVKDLVTVAFAEDKDLAKQYKQTLGDKNIPAVIKDNSSRSSKATSIAVMVPEEHLDYAHNIIEAMSAEDSFFDIAFQDIQAEFDNDDYKEIF